MSLVVAGLSARHGRIEVCRGINLTVAQGEFLVVLGMNGAGKSSLLGALAGSVAGAGEIRLGNRRLDHLPARARARQGLAFVPEGRRNLFAPLTVEENLRLGLRLLPAAERDATRSQIYALFPILAHRGAQVSGMMSGGEQQMLALAVAIARRPAVLLLDEPSQGLAPVVLEQIAAAILDLRRLGLSLILAEQNHRFAAILADRFLILRGGELRGGGPGHELADRALAASAIMGH